MDKIYCGSGKEKFEGKLVEIALCLSDIPNEFTFEYEGKKYVKLKVQKKRQADNYGKTHYVEVDQFKPKKQDDIPF